MKNGLILLLLLALAMVVAAGCASQSTNWEKSAEENTIAAYEAYLQKYPHGEFADEARTRIRRTRYQQAQATNTIEAFEEFLQDYPNGADANQASVKLESLFYGQARAEKSDQAYQQYLQRFPRHPRAEKIRLEWEKQDLDRAQALDTREAYEKFLQKHPQSSFAEEVRSRLSFESSFQIDRVLIVPWENLAGCADLSRYKIDNRIRFEKHQTDDGRTGYTLQPIDENGQINFVGDIKGAQTQLITGVMLDNCPDEQFFSVLGVGTYMAIESESWVEICGITCKTGTFRIIEQGIEFHPGTVFQESDNTQRAALRE